MFTADSLNRQQAHDKTAGKPKQQLNPDDQGQPAMNAASPDVETEFGASQNQVRTPMTKLADLTSLPSARA